MSDDPRDLPHLTHQEVAAVLEGRTLPYEREMHRHVCTPCRNLANYPRIQAMELQATRREYLLQDEGGYSFKVVTEQDPERGWSATVTIAALGMANEQAAVDRLWHPVLHLLRMLDTK